MGAPVKTSNSPDRVLGDTHRRSVAGRRHTAHHLHRVDGLQDQDERSVGRVAQGRHAEGDHEGVVGTKDDELELRDRLGDELERAIRSGHDGAGPSTIDTETPASGASLESGRRKSGGSSHSGEWARA